MNEKEITKLVLNFEKIIGPVARAIADEAASDFGILKNGKISPKSKKEYNLFIDRLKERYSKILGKSLVYKMISE